MLRRLVFGGVRVKGGGFVKFITGAVGGFILAVLASLLVTVTFAVSAGGNPSYGVVSFFVAWAVGLWVALTAPTTGKAWRRLLLTCSVLSFLLPLSGIIYTGSFMASHTQTGAEAAGAAIGGGLVSGVLGFIGFFIGVVFLIVGLLVGRDKQVVYVERAPSSSEAP